MNIVGTAKAFARALLEAAQDAGELDAIASDVLHLQSQYQASPELCAFCSIHHASSPDSREETITQLWSDTLRPRTLLVLQQMARWDILLILPPFFAAFLKLYNEARGIHVAHIQFALPPTEEVLSDLREKLAARFPNETLLIQSTHQPDLLAGFRVHVDDLAIDASLQGRIRRMTHS